jgi:hypothetical protein
MLTPETWALVFPWETDNPPTGRDGVSDVKRFDMTYADLANALRVIADELDTYANRDK